MVTFLFGAGAIEGAWNPIIEAVKESGFSNVTSNNINSLFSRLIYRIGREYNIIKINEFYKSPTLDNSVQLLDTIKSNIKKQLLHAQHSKILKCRDVESLRRSLRVDDFDISEGKSNKWAVIEISNLGLSLPSIIFCPYCLEEWYQYDSETKGYVRMRKPKWSQGIVGWGIG